MIINTDHPQAPEIQIVDTVAMPKKEVS